MDFVDTSIDHSAATSHRKNQIRSELLLRTLRKHHGPEIVEPEIIAEIKPARIVFIAPPQPSREFKELWFGLVEEEDFERPPLKIEEIKRVVGRYFDMNNVQLTSKRRQIKTTRPRQIAAYFCHKRTGRSLPEIGRRLGDRDHTTILSACRRIADLCMTDWKVAYDVAHLEIILDEINTDFRNRVAPEASAVSGSNQGFEGDGGCREAAQCSPERTAVAS